MDRGSGPAGEAVQEVSNDGRGDRVVHEAGFPDCLRCKVGVLIPLSDYGREGASIRYKAWVCSNPECGFNIRIDNGEISFGRTIQPSYK